MKNLNYFVNKMTIFLGAVIIVIMQRLCCNHCILDVLPFRNVTNSEFLEQHQFCSKKNLTFQLDPNELNELFVDDSMQLSNVNDIDYHDFFDI